MNRTLPSRAIIGMLHVPPLPGTPQHAKSLPQIVDHVLEEARLLVKLGYHALILENMHDAPYLKEGVGPEITAAMTTVATLVRAEFPDLPLGIQILAAANKEALAVAKAADLDFIRCEGFVFGHVADEGYIDGCAGELLRYRRQICAESVQVFCDIKKKHSSHAITADVSLAETAHAAEFFHADGLIVTGTATGTPTCTNDLQEARSASSLPLLVGSGCTPETIQQNLELADGIIVGSWIKEGGHWSNPIDQQRAVTLLAAAQ